MIASTSDDDTDVAGPGGFTGVTQNYTYARSFNLYLDPKEQHSYLTRKLAYNEAFLDGHRRAPPQLPGLPRQEDHLTLRPPGRGG